MLSTGIDLVETSRIKKSLENPLFMQRVFGNNEIASLKTKPFKQQILSAAAWFAAKEAFSKSLGTGIRNFKLSEVQVVHNELGAPQFVFSDNLKILVVGKTFSLSLTHTDNYAAAVVVAMSDD